MVSDFGRRLLAEPLARLAPWLVQLGLTPNMLTYLGFSLAVVTAVTLGAGYLRWGGILLVVAALFDTLDGAVARETGKVSSYGAFLDSTLDRYSESVIFLGLTYYYSASTEFRMEIVLVFVVLVGSYMVSYTRARAEALDIECKVGLLQRPERIILLAVGLLTGWMLPILWILAILTNFTALQRVRAVYTATLPHAPPLSTSNHAPEPTQEHEHQ
jgi:CDP-diacylglycerol--glycerol-3-phosphate 3-phosphatidyltransferase